jgi:lysylphosphatidylglycerol synthetase-like protein (DUF2156 family)
VFDNRHVATILLVLIGEWHEHILIYQSERLHFMSYLFGGESEQSRQDTLNELRDASFTKEDLAPRISDWFGVIDGLDDYMPMVGDSVLIILVIYVYMKSKNLIKKSILTKLTKPIQRVGLVLTVTGVAIILIVLLYDIINGNYVFNDRQRHYHVHYPLAWYCLTLSFVGAWLAWIHERTTARLIRWIKNR